MTFKYYEDAHSAREELYSQMRSSWASSMKLVAGGVAVVTSSVFANKVLGKAAHGALKSAIQMGKERRFGWALLAGFSAIEIGAALIASDAMSINALLKGGVELVDEHKNRKGVAAQITELDQILNTGLENRNGSGMFTRELTKEEVRAMGLRVKDLPKE